MEITVTIEIKERLVDDRRFTGDSIWRDAINSQNAIDAVLKNGVVLNLESTRVPHSDRSVTHSVKALMQFQGANLSLSGEAVRHLRGKDV